MYNETINMESTHTSELCRSSEAFYNDFDVLTREKRIKFCSAINLEVDSVHHVRRSRGSTLSTPHSDSEWNTVPTISGRGTSPGLSAAGPGAVQQLSRMFSFEGLLCTVQDKRIFVTANPA